MNIIHDAGSARVVELGDLDLRDLRYFATCCEEGQLTAAARRLRIGQPTLSHAMARLERRWGDAS